MKLRIRLLGPVELCVDDRIATPGAAKRRAMLAGLALAANHPVSLTRLASMVWADAPPASAVANLRSHAAGLRRALGERLVARPNAYELRLAPHELDIDEFQRLLGEGRALAAADPNSAIETLTAALAYWRGASGYRGARRWTTAGPASTSSGSRFSRSWPRRGWRPASTDHLTTSGAGLDGGLTNQLTCE